MLSADFQRICRDMYNIGNDIEITREDKKLKLYCSGDFANQETIIECMRSKSENIWYIFP